MSRELDKIVARLKKAKPVQRWVAGDLVYASRSLGIIGLAVYAGEQGQILESYGKGKKFLIQFQKAQGWVTPDLLSMEHP
jgi:hypothetical protein